MLDFQDRYGSYGTNIMDFMDCDFLLVFVTCVLFFGFEITWEFKIGDCSSDESGFNSFV